MRSFSLHFRSDARSLAVVAAYFVSTVAAWIFWPASWPARLAWIALNCVLSFVCAIIVHNTVHAPVFRGRNANRVFQILLSFTYGHPVSAYVPGHNFSHHQHTQTRYDAIRTTKARFRLNLLNQLFFFFIMSGDILKSEIRFARRMRRERPAWLRQYLLELALVMSAKIALLALDWRKAIFLILIPHQYAAWGVVGTNYWQHEGCDPDHPYNHSRTITGRFVNWFCFNNGYHGAHHLRPALHWSLLPEYHANEVRPHLDPRLEEVSLAGYLWRALIWPGRRVDYRGQPVTLPAEGPDADWVAAADLERYAWVLGAEGSPAPSESPDPRTASFRARGVSV